MTNNRCPQCDTPLDPELHSGLCPVCLLEIGTVEPAIDCHETIAQETSQVDPAATIGTSAGLASLDQREAFKADSDQQKIGDYDLIAEIARGGMGVVYRAKHRTLGREVALKVILSGQFASESDVRRFHMEAESAASLDHPGIVPIYEIGEHAGNHFFTMKLIQGGSLAQRLPQWQDQTRRMVHCLAEVAEAIDYAHRRGILHRDIKPANILIDQGGRPLVTDLGLAKRSDRDSDLTGTGAIVGTPAYMPPEQASASKEITTAADIYSLGAILYEGLVGRPPHQEDSAIATLMHAAEGRVTQPIEIDRSVDRTLELICMKCLQKDPSERYSSAAALAKDLRSWLAGDTVSVRPKSFASVFGDVLANQFRSAIGAMILGVLGGLATGVPVFANLAMNLIGRDNARFSLVKLKAVLPDAPVTDAWWLHFPKSLADGALLLLGIVLCLLIGLAIEKLVRPTNSRQALALGLVAGLLMTIVQFGLYGIAAMWNTYSIVAADTVEQMASAGFSPEAERQLAMKKIFESYPGLRYVDRNDQAEAINRLVSANIMLSVPPVFLGCLTLCLMFSTVFCVAGTIHAHRLNAAEFGMANTLLRYLEVMLFFVAIVVLMSLTIFLAFGMVTDNGEKVPFQSRLLVPLGLAVLACVPGFRMSHWYVRWPVYVICVTLGIVTLPT